MCVSTISDVVTKLSTPNLTYIKISTEHITMDVSQFTGEGYVLCKNTMQFGTQYQGYLPDLVEKFDPKKDTIIKSKSAYIFRSCCCPVIVPTLYTSSFICGVLGLFEMGCTCCMSETCCNIADTLIHNTTHYGKNTCLYETYCAVTNEQSDISSSSYK